MRDHGSKTGPGSSSWLDVGLRGDCVNIDQDISDTQLCTEEYNYVSLMS